VNFTFEFSNNILFILLGVNGLMDWWQKLNLILLIEVKELKVHGKSHYEINTFSKTRWPQKCAPLDILW